MKFISTKDLQLWADTVDCSYNLPHLVRKLILATTDMKGIKHIHFPYGDDIQTGGYDGELDTDSGNAFVPFGASVWEFGTTDKKKGKADEDYSKRVKDPLDKIPAETTYINVNAKKYRDKNKWVAEKKADNFWRDVRYLDAIDLEQWLELAPTVELWLAERLRKPTLGIFTLGEYWSRWSESSSLKIVPELLLGRSRQKETEAINAFLNSQSTVLYIKSITTDEAVAFPIAVIKSCMVESLNVVVIDNRESFNRFVNTDQLLVIIVKFKIDNVDLRGATQKGHKVIIPLGPAEEASADGVLQLQIVSGDAFEQGLVKMEIDPEQARRLSKTSGRNIAVLKRLLHFDSSLQPGYLDGVEARNIVPMLLLNSIDEKVEGDRLMVERLAGKSFASYASFLKHLANSEDAPVYNIGGIWKLVSPTDTWLFFAKYLTHNDLLLFQEACVDILTEVLYRYTLPPGKQGLFFQTPETRSKYSQILREGICDSLLVLAAFGHDYGIHEIPGAAGMADVIVDKVLSREVAVWRSLGTELMCLAEAAPEVFLKHLERILGDKSVSAFFELRQGLLNSSNDLAQLLWCLDVLAWFPDYLLLVSTALCELERVAPEKLPSSNTPLNSLQGIYRSWYPQTNTNYDGRTKILSVLSKRYPDTTYALLFGFLQNTHDSALHTPRPRYRLFSQLRQITVTNVEVYNTVNFYIRTVIDLSIGMPERLTALVEILDNITWDKIEDVLEAIVAYNYSPVEQKILLKHFRELLGRHRTYCTADWALPKEQLVKIEAAASKFVDDGPLGELYLFEEQYPEFLEGHNEDDEDHHDQAIMSRRKRFAETVVGTFGVEKIFELALDTDYPDLYGDVLAHLENLKEQDALKIYLMADSENEKHKALVAAFIRASSHIKSLQSQLDMLDSLISQGFTQSGILSFLTALRGSLDLYSYISGLGNIDLEAQYWKSRVGFLYTQTKQELFYALDKLLKVGKSITYLNTLGWGAYVYKDELTSEEVLKAMEDVNLSDFDDNSRLDSSRFRNLIDFLHKRADYDVHRAAKMEMKFSMMFSSGSSGLKPQNLHQIMSEQPEEYFGIISQIYLPDEGPLRDSTIKEMQATPGFYEMIKVGRQILDSFRNLPSMDKEGNLDEGIFKAWILRLQELAKEHHRIKATEDNLGSLLAKYPVSVKTGLSYPAVIYDTLEEGSDGMRGGFQRQLYNAMGFTSRAAFEGGTIERNRADYFESFYKETIYTHPKVAALFKNLRDNYIVSAKAEDDEALLRSLE